MGEICLKRVKKESSTSELDQIPIFNSNKLIYGQQFPKKRNSGPQNRKREYYGITELV